MTRFYQIFGIIICLLVAYANFIGWEIVNFNNFDRVGPAGPGVYHK